MRSGSEATAAYRHAAQGERDVDIDEPVRLSGILSGSEERAIKAGTRSALARGGRQAGVRDHTTDTLKAEIHTNPAPTSLAMDRVAPRTSPGHLRVLRVRLLRIIKETGKWKRS